MSVTHFREIGVAPEGWQACSVRVPVEKDYRRKDNVVSAVNEIVVNQRTVACEHIILYIDLF